MKYLTTLYLQDEKKTENGSPEYVGETKKSIIVGWWGSYGSTLKLYFTDKKTKIKERIDLEGWLTYDGEYKGHKLKAVQADKKMDIYYS